MVAERNDSIARDADASEPKLSYKFQRLRERIRAAIEGGELAGKLPGERALARQFNVNAKTLSKALTDLAAEGMLERNIGLGTFVRGHTSSVSVTNALLLAAEDAAGHLATALTEAGIQTTAQSAGSELPPSLIAPYRLILVASPSVTDDAIRNLLVRGKEVLTIDRLSTPYSTHAILSHSDRAAVLAAIELAEARADKLLVVTDSPVVTDVVRAALPEMNIRSTATEGIAEALSDGYDWIVCQADLLDGMKVAIGSAAMNDGMRSKILGFGRSATAPALVAGYYITDAMIAAAVAEMLAAGLPHKPLTLWLTGQRFEGRPA